MGAVVQLPIILTIFATSIELIIINNLLKKQFMKKIKFSFVSIVLAMAGGMLASCSYFDNPLEPKVDPRVAEIIPTEIREKVSEFMPIYDGVNPPNIEGAYFMDPNILIGSSKSDDIIGNSFLSQDFKFFNQDMTKNTIDMYRVQGTGWSKGNGAFISGSGDNFTVYFDAEGADHGIWVKKTYVFSGTMTSAGIANFTYTFIMKDKGDDPDDSIVEVGTYRVFKDEDGLAEKCEWTHGDDFGGSGARAAARGNELPVESSK